MVIFDANIILRYLLGDNNEMKDRAYAYNKVKGIEIATFDKNYCTCWLRNKSKKLLYEVV